MVSHIRPRTAAALFVWFAILAGAPLAALGWLGWRWLAQERALDEQRQREQIETTASLVVGGLERSIAAWEDRIASIARGEAVLLPAGVSALVFDARGVTRRFGTSLPYYPAVAATPEPAATRFADAEILEFG